MRIQKRVQGRYFKMVLEGRKPFEVRLADFKSKPGDILVLLEQKDGTKTLTGRKLECEVMFKFNTKAITRFYSKKAIERYGLVVLGIRPKYKYK